MNVCVFCSSSSAVAEPFRRAAQELGQLLAAKGHTLIYGGCHVGLMGEVARAAKAAGGRVVGVVPRSFVDYGLVFEPLDELITVDSLAERKDIMERRSDAFIALPGGFGTLDELLQVIALRQLGLLNGPIVLMNVEGFYDHLLAHFQVLYQEKLAKPEACGYYVALDAQEALAHVESFVVAP
jgi:uncharacterized protein (TIGR00730 family)